jgi:TonB-dependent receptor
VTFQKQLHNEYETMRSQVFTIGGKQALGEATVDYLVGYSKGQDNRPMDQTVQFSNPTVASETYNNVANPSVPAILSVSGVDPANPNGYTLSNLQNLPYLAQTTEWTEQANIEAPTHFFSFADSEHFKTGVSARQKKNSLTVTTLNNSSPPGLPLSQVVTGAPVTYYDAGYNIGPNMDIGTVQRLFNQGMVLDPVATAQAASQNTENVLAAYMQEEMTFGRLSLLYGLRVENTTATHSGNAVSGSTITPVSTNSSYTNVFPSVQARYELTPTSLLRASISSTISRPGFNQSSASTIVSIGTNSVITGNPNLKPTLSTNFDLSFEHYLPDGGIMSAGVFDKALKDYIVAQVGFKNFPNGGIYSGLGANTTVVTYGNISSARARGLELNYEQHYTFLPSFLSGLGTAFNYTYVDSTIQIRPGENGMLPSTSKNSWNAEVFWERNGLTLTLAANYQGRSLAGIGSNASTDIYSEARTSLDFGASYQVAKNYSIFASAKNLTNTPLKYSEGTSDRLIQREYYGPTFEVGANIHF